MAEETKSSTTLTSPEFKQKLSSLFSYLVNHLGIKVFPTVKLINSKSNATNPFGLTGHYDHKNHVITLYITDRHDTDILRSFAHEVIHHWQQLNGTLHPEERQGNPLPTKHDTSPHYAQYDVHLRKREMEAYLFGNILFRDWQDEQRHGPPKVQPLMPQPIKENLTIQNPARLKQGVENLLGQFAKDGTIASYHRERTSGDMNPEDFVEDIASDVMSTIEQHIQTINNKGNWENQPNMIRESENVSITGATEEYPELHTLMDVGYDVSRNALWPTIDKELTPEEQTQYRKYGLGLDTIAPDGNDFDKPTGTLNFYIAGIPESFIQKIIEKIQDRLDVLGIEHGPVRGPEQSGLFRSQVYRIPVIKNPNAARERAPDFNIANRNYQVLFHKLLGLVGDDQWGFSFPIETIEKAIAPYLKGTDTDQMKKLEPYTIEPGKIEAEPPPLPGDEWKGPESPENYLLRNLGGTAQDMGLTVNQLSRYIHNLNDIVQWAKTHGYKRISGG